MTYARNETLQAFQIGKRMINKTETVIREGIPTIAKNTVLGTENKANRYDHIGIKGRINRRFDIKI